MEMENTNVQTTNSTSIEENQIVVEDEKLVQKDENTNDNTNQQQQESDQNEQQQQQLQQQQQIDSTQLQQHEVSENTSIQEQNNPPSDQPSDQTSDQTSGGNPENIKTYNIFVGDLRSNVTEQDLYDAFKDCGEIHSVHVIRDKITGVQKGYGFVHFKTKEAREIALKPPYSNQDIKGRACRVNLPDEKNTLWINNIPLELNEAEVKQELQNLLPSNIVLTEIELKTGPAPDYASRGFAFVTFENHDVADQARKILSKSNIKGRLLNVSWAEPKREVDESVMKTVKTLFVSNLHNAVTEEQLQGLFLQFGDIKNCTIVRDNQGESKGFAFVEYNDRETCEDALNYLKGETFCGLPLEIQFAKPPQEKDTSSKKSKDSKARSQMGSMYPGQRQTGRGQQRGQPVPSNGRIPQQQWGGIPTQPYAPTVYPQGITSVPTLQTLASAYTTQGQLTQPYSQQYYNTLYAQYGQGVYGQTQPQTYYGQYTTQGYTQPTRSYIPTQTSQTQTQQPYPYPYYYSQPQQSGQSQQRYS